MLPEISTVAPNSVMARVKASAVPARIAGSRFGRMIRRKMVSRPAPSDAAPSSISWSSSTSTGLHGADDERQRHEQQGDDDAGLLVGDVDADRAVRAVEREQHEAGDDRRQREREVDEHVEDRLPGKESRTSTQAIRVPITRLISATIRLATIVSFRADLASGVVTECQNVPSRPWCRVQTTAASGMSTIRLR